MSYGWGDRSRRSGKREREDLLAVPQAHQTPPLGQTLVAVGAVVLSMVSVTSGAALAKSLFSAIGPEGSTALRNGYGALMLLAFWRPWRGGWLSLAQWKAVAMYGACLGLMNLFFYTSLQYLPLGLAVAIEFIGPFTLALVMSRRYTDFLWLLLAVAGLALLLPWGEGPIAADPRGIAFALAAGALWALYIVFGQKAAGLLPGGACHLDRHYHRLADHGAGRADPCRYRDVHLVEPGGGAGRRPVLLGHPLFDGYGGAAPPAGPHLRHHDEPGAGGGGAVRSAAAGGGAVAAPAIRHRMRDDRILRQHLLVAQGDGAPGRRLGAFISL